jgi:hypothetical protein
MLLGPPKSRAGRRIVGIPEVIVPALRENLAVFAGDDPGVLGLPRRQGRPGCGGATSPRCPPGRHAVESIGTPGLHFHDLRHTGNQFPQRRQAPGPDGPDGGTTATGPR